MKGTYSIAIQPSPPVVGRVAEMKKALREAIGTFYHSIHAKAHISLFNFEMAESQYPVTSTSFKNQIAGLAPFPIVFDGIDHFHHTDDAFTCYVRLRNESAQAIIKCCQEMKRELPHVVKRCVSLPHMSIGRKLTRADSKLKYHGQLSLFV